MTRRRYRTVSRVEARIEGEEEEEEEEEDDEQCGTSRETPTAKTCILQYFVHTCTLPLIIIRPRHMYGRPTKMLVTPCHFSGKSVVHKFIRKQAYGSSILVLRMHTIRIDHGLHLLWHQVKLTAPEGLWQGLPGLIYPAT